MEQSQPLQEKRLQILMDNMAQSMELFEGP